MAKNSAKVIAKISIGRGNKNEKKPQIFQETLKILSTYAINLLGSHSFSPTQS